MDSDEMDMLDSCKNTYKNNKSHWNKSILLAIINQYINRKNLLKQWSPAKFCSWLRTRRTFQVQKQCGTFTRDATVSILIRFLTSWVNMPKRGFRIRFGLHKQRLWLKKVMYVVSQRLVKTSRSCDELKRLRSCWRIDYLSQNKKVNATLFYTLSNFEQILDT